MQPPTGAITSYRTMELYSAKTLVTLVRRLRTGYFAVILPFFVVACDINLIYTQKALFAGQPVFAIEKAGDSRSDRRKKLTISWYNSILP
jgi:hypothetical protein